MSTLISPLLGVPPKPVSRLRQLAYQTIGATVATIATVTIMNAMKTPSRLPTESPCPMTAYNVTVYYMSPGCYQVPQPNCNLNDICGQVIGCFENAVVCACTNSAAIFATLVGKIWNSSTCQNYTVVTPAQLDSTPAGCPKDSISLEEFEKGLIQGNQSIPSVPGGLPTHGPLDAPSQP